MVHCLQHNSLRDALTVILERERLRDLDCTTDIYFIYLFPLYRCEIQGFAKNLEATSYMKVSDFQCTGDKYLHDYLVIMLFFLSNCPFSVLCSSN